MKFKNNIGYKSFYIFSYIYALYSKTRFILEYLICNVNIFKNFPIDFETALIFLLFFTFEEDNFCPFSSVFDTPSFE